jgi:type I restriction enzyme S subunit
MKKVKLGDIADVIAGQSPPSKYYSETQGTPFMQGNRTFGDKYPTIDTYTTKITKLAKKGDTLISVRAPVGDINVACCDLCIGRGLAGIRAKKGCNEFIYYILKTNVAKLLSKSSGTTFESINKFDLDNLELEIPDDYYQKSIATLLSNLDRKIELNNSINKELEALAKTIYDYWFVQFDFPDENGKPYKSSDGEMVYNET